MSLIKELGRLDRGAVAMGVLAAGMLGLAFAPERVIKPMIESPIGITAEADGELGLTDVGRMRLMFLLGAAITGAQAIPLPKRK